MRRSLLVIVVLLLLNACTSTGELRDALENTEFANDRSTQLIIRTPEQNAYEVRTLNGEYVRTLVATNYGLADVDDYGERVLVRTGADFVAVEAGGTVRSLDMGRGWRNVALNGSGTRIATTNNQERLIRILSFDTLDLLQEIPCPEDAACWWLGWDMNNTKILWLGGYSHNGFERLDLATGESESVARETLPWIKHPGETMLHNSSSCRRTGATLIPSDSGIVLQEPDREPRSLVTIRGKRNPIIFGESYPAIDRAGFIADCEYVIFGFGGDDWLVDVESGLIGRLAGKVWYVLSQSSVTP